MKNIKEKICAIMAAAVMLIGAGTSAGAGNLPTPKDPDIPGIEEGEIPPKGSNGGEASTNGDYDDVINLGI